MVRSTSRHTKVRVDACENVVPTFMGEAFDLLFVLLDETDGMNDATITCPPQGGQTMHFKEKGIQSGVVYEHSTMQRSSPWAQPSGTEGRA